MSKKTFLAAVIILAFLISIVVGMQVVEVAWANFTIPKQIVSPASTTYRVNYVPLNVRIEIGEYYRMVINATVNKVFYSLDGQENLTIPFSVTETNANGYV